MNVYMHEFLSEFMYMCVLIHFRHRLADKNVFPVTCSIGFQSFAGELLGAARKR